MEYPLEIVFRGVERTPKLDDLIADRVAKLEKTYPQLVGCRVAVENEVRRQVNTAAYRVRIELSVPNDHLVAVHEPTGFERREELLVAVRHAFEKAQRQLNSFKERLRGDVKAHVAPPHAVVSRIFPQDGYGFLATPDGRELYFHENAVVDADFDDLYLGQEVRFSEGMGTEGPTATTVHIIGRSGHHELTPPAPA